MSTDTPSIIIASEARERVHRRSAQLPERLTRLSCITLAGVDAGTLLFVSLIALSASGNALVAALLTTGTICAITWQAGLYSRSYAVFPRDEAYYACASVALAAIPIAFVLIAIGGVSAVFVVTAILLSALASSVVRVRLHLERRARPLSATLHSISPRGWADRENPRYRVSQRAFDLAIAAIAFAPVCAIMLVTAIAIVIDSGRPILFRQERIGRNAVPFTIYKFRTLRADAGSSWVKRGDDRITRIGASLRRSSFDELPQIFNVLKGDMSIVGPRPEMVEFAYDFGESIPNYAQRHVVTPGITGWAQVYYKRNLAPGDVSAVLSYDLFYVEHASIVMDCALIFKTLCEVLVRPPA